MKDIRISDHGNWRHLHWNAIESAYNSTPFFEYYKDDFRPFYEKKYEFLTDFNEELCRLVCELIDIQPAIERKNIKQTLPRTKSIFAKRSIPRKIFTGQIRNLSLSLTIRYSKPATVFYPTWASSTFCLIWDRKACWYCRKHVPILNKRERSPWISLFF